MIKFTFSGNLIFICWQYPTICGSSWDKFDDNWIRNGLLGSQGPLWGGGGRKKNKNVKGVGGTPGSSHANPIQKEEKRFSGRVMGSMETDTADIASMASMYSAFTTTGHEHLPSDMS